MTIPHPPSSSGADIAETRNERGLRGRARFFPQATDAEWNDWKWQFKHRITRLEELAALLPFPEKEWEMRREVLRDFRMGITPYYLALADPDDPASGSSSPTSRYTYSSTTGARIRWRRSSTRRSRGSPTA